MAEDQQNVGFGDIFDLSFKKYVTPTVIRVLFILVMVFAGLLWLSAVIGGFSSNAGAGFGALIIGGVGFFMFILMYRVFFELVMVIFAIKENTKATADALQNQG